MKKYFLLALVGFFIFLPNVSNATSGSCSSHLGVNCSYGADLDGSVVCNDGWKDSSVGYYTTDECFDTGSQCNYPVASCTEYQYSALQVEAQRAISNAKGLIGQRAGGVLSSASTSYVAGITNDYNLRLQACRNAINLYSELKDKYDECVSDEKLQKQQSADNLQKINDLVYQAKLDSLNKQSIILNNNSCIANYGSNSYYNEGQDSCSCNDGYIIFNNKCTSYNEYCQFQQGENSYGNKYGCHCSNGFKLDNGKCVKEISISTVSYKATSSDIKIDTKLSSRLKGKILLQTESHGEAWYINPKDGKRYYMANGEEAYNIMRKFGIGITNSNLEKIQKNKNLAKKQSGKILLKVEDKGQAYYIDFNGVAHYLKDGAEAYNAMRKLGLGVKNSDLNKIEIGE
jgi:hypothetical protein